MGGNAGSRMLAAARWLASTLACGGVVAGLVVLLGTRDLESYEHAFFSLDRGTAAEPVRVLGHPVYTMALGLGVRLPLQANLGASPAANLTPYVPVPVAYWLLVTFAVGMSVAVVRHALEPLCGRATAALAVVLLFWSVPIVNYTIVDDWLESAVTYPSFIVCVFAPHALFAVIASTGRRLACLAAAGILWSLVALAHPGHWPLLAVTLLLASVLALLRSDQPVRTRLAVVVVLAIASCIPVAFQVPDILRELYLASASAIGETRRLVGGASGHVLTANLYPLGDVEARSPFTYLVLALVSLSIGLTAREPHLRRLTVGGAIISVACGAASTMSPGTSAYAPSIMWALRDPAAAFAILSASCAAAVVYRRRGSNRRFGGRPVLMALMLAGLQGPAYATSLAVAEVRQDGNRWRWNQDQTSPEARVAGRGLARDRIPGGRLSLWPGVRDEMRDQRHASIDFADAGYPLVTAWTKQRTMRRLVEPNEWLFNQNTELSPEILCDSKAVQFLQLRYLLRPPDVECAPWASAQGLLVDGWLEVAVAGSVDQRVRAFAVAGLPAAIGDDPALSAHSQLISALRPLPGTSVTIDARGVVVRLEQPSLAEGQALVLPIAYDQAWRTSSGSLQDAGGLVALLGIDHREVMLAFVPDLPAILWAWSMTLAQIVGLGGLFGLAYVRPRQ